MEGKTEEIQLLVCFTSWQTNTPLAGRLLAHSPVMFLKPWTAFSSSPSRNIPNAHFILFPRLSQSLRCLFHRLHPGWLVPQGRWRLVLCREMVVPSDFPVTWNSFTSSPSATNTGGPLYNPCAGQNYPWGLRAILYAHNRLTNSYRVSCWHDQQGSD